MTEIILSDKIEGVKFTQVHAFGDDRGRFMETFRKEWFPERAWDIVQANRSDSQAGVLRGLHYHLHQVDYWFVVRGTVRVGMADLRRGSPTFGASQTIEIGDNNLMGVFIPIGVAHGFYTVTDATLSYLVDNYYDGDDEFGVAWDDPTLAVDWAVHEPILSGRDLANPTLANIPAEQMPVYSNK